MNYQPFKYIYQASGNPDANTLLLLHGTGGDEQDLLPLAKQFGTDINVLSLRGNVLEGGMPRFFKRLGMGVFDEEDLAFRTHELVAFVKELAVTEDFDVHKVIALGYSNGANIAGSTLLLYPDFLAGAILYRPMQPFKKLAATVHNSTANPIFLSNGATDPTINPADTAALIATLKDADFKVSAHTLNTGHNLSHQDIQLSQVWYQAHFKQGISMV